MLTAAEARKRLRIGEKTLRRLITEGEIAAVKVGYGRWGGSYRISEKAIEDYIERQTVQPASAQ